MGGPRKGERHLWGEEKPRYRWNFPLAENRALYLVLRRRGNLKCHTCGQAPCGYGSMWASAPTRGIDGACGSDGPSPGGS